MRFSGPVAKFPISTRLLLTYSGVKLSYSTMVRTGAAVMLGETVGVVVTPRGRTSRTLRCGLRPLDLITVHVRVRTRPAATAVLTRRRGSCGRRAGRGGTHIVCRRDCACRYGCGRRRGGQVIRTGCRCSRTCAATHRCDYKSCTSQESSDTDLRRSNATIEHAVHVSPWIARANPPDRHNGDDTATVTVDRWRGCRCCASRMSRWQRPAK